MSRRIPVNVIKYVIILAISEYFIKQLPIPYEGGTMIHEQLVITLPQIAVIMSTVTILGFALQYFCSILADKYGRRLAWAISLFLFGGGMVLMALATSYRMAFIASIPWGVSTAFAWTSVAWLFDHEGKEGLKTAYGLIYIVSVLSIVAGMEIALKGESSPRMVIVSTGVIALVLGGWVMTFPENYGNRSSSWLEIAKTGIRQVMSRRILQLIVLYSLFTAPTVSAAGMSQFYLEEKFVFSFNEIVQSYEIVFYISIVAALFAGITVLVLGKPDYRKLAVYPAVFMGVSYVLLPLAPTVSLFYILKGGCSFFSLITTAGIMILINDSILENRATTLTFVLMLGGFSKVSGHLWTMYFDSQRWEILFLISGVLAMTAVLFLFWAVKLHEKQ
ncbi:MAG: MFS transporter [Theionarchaea archaeon]|nr:MFS transporter [Theionarchaea archaeon]